MAGVGGVYRITVFEKTLEPIHSEWMADAAGSAYTLGLAIAEKEIVYRPLAERLIYRKSGRKWMSPSRATEPAINRAKRCGSAWRRR